jgi:carboxymethylenebutenolidase
MTLGVTYVSRMPVPLAIHRARTPRGGVVVLPDLGGVDAPLARRIEELCGSGWDVVVPDTWWRDPEGRPDVSTPDAVTIAWARANDLGAVSDALEARGALPTGLPRFVLGVGAGGVHARMVACMAGGGLTGAVEFEGRLVHGALGPTRPAQPLDLLPGLGCPLLAHIAADDPTIPPAHVAAFRERLSHVRVSALVHVYKGASRGFTGTRTLASRTAWARTHAFFEHLAGAAA